MSTYSDEYKDDDAFEVVREGGVAFLQMSAEVQMDKVLTPTEKCVYATLCLYCNGCFKEQRACFPSVKDIAEKTNCNVRTARRALQALKERGALKIVKTRQKDGRQGHNRYVLMNKLPEIQSDKNVPIQSDKNDLSDFQSDKYVLPECQKGEGVTITKELYKEPPIAPQGAEREGPEEELQDVAAVSEQQELHLEAQPSVGNGSEKRNKSAAGVERLEKWFEEQFWPNYPRHEDKKRARQTFIRVLQRARNPDDQLQQVRNMGVRLSKYIADCRDKDPRFIKHPATWLNAHDFSENPEESEILHEEVFVKHDGTELRRS